MAKRRHVVKLTPVQTWYNEVNKLTAKRDSALAVLSKVVPTLAKAQRTLERAKRKEEMARADEAKAKKAKAKKAKATKPPAPEAVKFAETLGESCDRIVTDLIMDRKVDL